MAATLVNLILFQASWFSAVLGAAGGWPLAGTLPALVTVGAHLAMNRSRAGREALLILAVTVMGLALEAAFMALGVITYAGSATGDLLPPPWIGALWLAFGTLPHGSLNWLSGRWVLQAVLGALLGPVSYLAGARLGAASLGGDQWLALTVIAAGWAAALPLIYAVARCTWSGRTR